MKLRIIASALLLVVLSAGISSTAGANPWRHCRGGWYPPHPVVRLGIPVPPIPQIVIGGGGYGGYYGRPYSGGHRYYAHEGYRHYGHEYRGGYGHYGHGHHGRW